MDPAALNTLLTGSAGAVGALAVVLVLIIGGKLVPGFVYEREVKRADGLADQIPQNTEAMRLLMGALGDQRRRSG